MLTFAAPMAVPVQHLVHGPIFEDLSAFMLEHGSRMNILLA
jgi:hypothetical protein